MTAAEIAALVAEAEAFLAAPQSATVDGRSATNRSVADFIALKKWEAEQAATPNAGRGLRFTQLVPGSCG
jgi:hypothetical protein